MCMDSFNPRSDHWYRNFPTTAQYLSIHKHIWQLRIRWDRWTSRVEQVIILQLNALTKLCFQLLRCPGCGFPPCILKSILTGNLCTDDLYDCGHPQQQPERLVNPAKSIPNSWLISPLTSRMKLTAACWASAYPLMTSFC